MRISTRGVIISLIAVLIVTTACSIGEAPRNDEIAVVQLENGGYVKFLSPEPGELIVTALSEKPLEGLAALSPVALYESLTSTPAPKALIDASQTGEDVPAIEEAEERDEASIPDAFVAIEDSEQSSSHRSISLTYVGSMNAEEFKSRYGRGYGDGADYVWTDCGGDGWAKSKAKVVVSYVVANIGPVIHVLTYKKQATGKWRTKYTQGVPAGYCSYFWYGTNKKKHKKCSIVLQYPHSVWYHAMIAFMKD